MSSDTKKKKVLEQTRQRTAIAKKVRNTPIAVSHYILELKPVLESNVFVSSEQYETIDKN